MAALGELQKGSDRERETARQLSSYAMNAVACAATGGLCTDARAIYAQHFRMTNGAADERTMERGFAMVARDCLAH
jgi:hypothetical protein